MINYNSIADALINQIGFSQLPSDLGVQLTTDLVTSNTGLYYEHAHPLLNAYSIWQYAPQHIINMSESVERNEAFSGWIKTQITAGTISTVQRWANEKNIDRSGKNVLENNTLYLDSYADREISNISRLASIKIETPIAKNTKLRIYRVAFTLFSPATFTAYLYKTGSSIPIENVPISHNGTGQEWFTVNWDLSNLSEYYVAVNEDELEADNANLVLDTPIYDGSHNSVRRTNHCTFRPCYLQGGFNEQRISFTTDRVGINIDYSVLVDYTDFLLNHISKFYYPCMLGVAMKCIELMLYNPDVNVTRGTLTYPKETLSFELYGDTQGALHNRYKKAIEAIKLNHTNLDATTMNRRGVKIRLNNVG